MMMHRTYRKPFRIPHRVAAVAALTLVVTAWPGFEHSAPVEATRAGLTDSERTADSGSHAADGAGTSTSEISLNARQPLRISLMLFRFD